MHRISCFGAVSKSTYAHYRAQGLYSRYTNGLNAFTPYDLFLKIVEGVDGPRCETQKKGKTIPGWPGGPVNDVDHQFLGGICYTDASDGWEHLSDYSLDLVIPACNCTFDDYEHPRDPPGDLARGESRGKLMSCEFINDPQTNPNSPTWVEFKILVVNRTLYPLPDQYMRSLLTFELHCPVSGDGHYRIGEAKYLVLRPIIMKLIPPPPLPPFLNWMGIGAISQLTGQFALTPPSVFYLSSILAYWDKEKKALAQLDMEGDRVRECTLSAMEGAAFTEALSMENVKDLFELADTIRGAIGLYGTLRSALRTFDPLKLLKFVASVHLIYRYVIKTSWRDLCDLRNLAEQVWVHRDTWWEFLAIARGRCPTQVYPRQVNNGKIYQTVMNLRLDLRPAQYQLFTYMRTVGLGPSLVGFWDLVPWSFAIDWVLSIGDTIEAIGALKDLQFINKLFVISVKSHRQVSEEICPGVFLLGESQRFQRVVSRNYEGSAAYWGLRVRNPLKNFWTMVALVIASITRR